jgi:hypothetical protein
MTLFLSVRLSLPGSFQFFAQGQDITTCILRLIGQDKYHMFVNRFWNNWFMGANHLRRPQQSTEIYLNLSTQLFRLTRLLEHVLADQFGTAVITITGGKSSYFYRKTNNKQK